MQRKISNELKILIAEDYKKGLSYREIIDKHNINSTLIVRVKRKYNLPNRKLATHNCIEDIFENIDTPEKAYWLGFMISDGNISKDNKRVKFEICDYDSIEKFVKFLNYKNKISHIIHKDNRQDSYSIDVSSEKMTQDLAKYGVVPRKTFLTFLPEIPKHLMSYLIAGLWDGDGTLYRQEKYSVAMNLVGNYDLVEAVREFLISNLGLKNNKLVKHKKIYRCGWSSENDVRTLCNYLYNTENSDLYLTRKYNLAMEFINEINKKQSDRMQKRIVSKNLQYHNGRTTPQLLCQWNVTKK